MFYFYLFLTAGINGLYGIYNTYNAQVIRDNKVIIGHNITDWIIVHFILFFSFITPK
jgi:hypothetical protein